jgi:hypothetical protein
MARRAPADKVLIAAGYPCPEDTRAYYFSAIYLAARCQEMKGCRDEDGVIKTTYYSGATIDGYSWDSR